MSTIELQARELAFRSHEGVEVALLWWKEDDRLAVSVVDLAAGDAFVVPVAGERPLDVFEHPYAHATRLGIV